MIDYSCPWCHHKMSLPDSKGGEKEECPKCHKKILVPVDVPPVPWRKVGAILCILIGVGLTVAAIWTPYQIITSWEAQRQAEETCWKQEQDYESYIELEEDVIRGIGGARNLRSGGPTIDEAIQRAAKIAAETGIGNRRAIVETAAVQVMKENAVDEPTPVTMENIRWLIRQEVERSVKVGTTKALEGRTELFHHQLGVLSAGVWSLVLSFWAVAAFVLAAIILKRPKQNSPESNEKQ